MYKKKENPQKLHLAKGSDLLALVRNFRRRGMTASFGIDKDPKLIQKG